MNEEPLPPDEPGDDATGQPDDSPESLPINPFSEQLEAAQAERDQNYERWVRSQAEMENIRRRNRQEQEDLRRYQSAPLATDLLPAFDNLKRAIDAARGSEAAEGTVSELLAGLEMVHTQLQTTLGNHGITAIEAVGQPFDPNLHEALSQMPSEDHPPMTVLQEIETGYRMHDRVLRPSKVIVSANPPT